MGGNKVKDLPAHKRPREQLVSAGPSHISTQSLLAILLGTGTKKHNSLSLARKILRSFSLAELAQISVTELVEISGVGNAKACRVVAGFELAHRVHDRESRTRLVSNPEEVLREVGEIARYRQEHIVVLYLNSRYHLLKKRTVAIGSTNASLIHPRDVFAPALSVPATQIVLAHNHPSGESDPSEADLKFTERIAAAGELLGIEVVDHIVVSAQSHFSFKAHNLF